MLPRVRIVSVAPDFIVGLVSGDGIRPGHARRLNDVGRFHGAAGVPPSRAVELPYFWRKGRR